MIKEYPIITNEALVEANPGGIMQRIQLSMDSELSCSDFKFLYSTPRDYFIRFSPSLVMRIRKSDLKI
jgi:hypothetical protein